MMEHGIGVVPGTGGLYVKLLLDRAGTRGHDQHPVRQNDGFPNVVRNEQNRFACTHPDFFQLFVQNKPRLLVERRERLIHKQNFRVHRQRPGNRSALLHPARQLVRIPIGEFAQVHRFNLLHRERLALLPGHPLLLEAKGDVVQHGKPGKQRMLLKHNDAVRPRGVARLAVHRNFALLGLLQPGDQVKQRRFAAARRSKQRNEFAFADRQRNIVDGGKRTARTLVKNFADVFNFDHIDLPLTDGTTKKELYQLILSVLYGMSTTFFTTPNPYAIISHVFINVDNRCRKSWITLNSGEPCIMIRLLTKGESRWSTMTFAS